MNELVLFIILTVFIMIIAWIGNGISDRITDFFRNGSVRHENASRPAKQEKLSDRYK